MVRTYYMIFSRIEETGEAAAARIYGEMAQMVQKWYRKYHFQKVSNPQSLAAAGGGGRI